MASPWDVTSPIIPGAHHAPNRNPPNRHGWFDGGSTSEHRGRYREKEHLPSVLCQPTPAGRRHLAAAFAVTALTGTVMAGGPPSLKSGADVQKANLLVANNCLSSDVSTTTTGGVVTLVTPSGESVLNVNGSAKGVAASTTYDVWVRDLGPAFLGDSTNSAPSIGYYDLGSFTTDALGAGSFHLGFKTDVLPDGKYTIQVALNGDNGTQYGCTVQATAFNIVVDID